MVGTDSGSTVSGADGDPAQDGLGTSALSTAVDLAEGTRIEVEPEQLLDVARVVTERADGLAEVLLRNAPTMRVGPPSENAVSVALASAWNDAVVDSEDSHLARAQAYLKGLRGLQVQLRAAVERYDLNEDEIADAFGERR